LNWLLKLAIALVPTILDWGLKNSAKIVGSIGNFFKSFFENRKTKKEERKVGERKLTRSEITKKIEEATAKGDHEELKKLHVALHLLDNSHK